LKNVLHDWDDERSLAIMGNIRRAMTPGQRLLVVEVLVEADSDHHATEVDLHMMMVCDEGRERRRAEYNRLLVASGFQLERGYDTPRMGAILESVAVER